MSSSGRSSPPRPHTKVVLAMTADGKIADRSGQAARFGSASDRYHLEQHIAQADATLIGAGTLRAYGTSLAVREAQLLQHRQEQQKPAQPIQILCSASGQLDPAWRFFQQPFPRWLVTLQREPGQWWQRDNSTAFERIIEASPDSTQPTRVNWNALGPSFLNAGIENLCILGGGQLIASLLEQGWIDEFILTLCPFLLGGATAPTAIAGWGFSQNQAVPLQLEHCRSHGDEVFLQYRVLSSRLTTQD